MNSKPRIGVTPYFNYDSGEEYMPEGYIRGVEHVGGEMVTLHYDTPLEALKDIVDGLDGLIFAGGPDIHPKFFGQEIDPKCGRINLQRDELELKLFECAALRRLPVFGICRGIQLINVAMGGTLIQDVPSVYPGAVHQQEAARLGACLAGEGAEQCGFCAPGLMMNVFALAKENPGATDAEIDAFLAGNLCRCSGYVSQRRAIRAYLSQVRGEVRA